MDEFVRIAALSDLKEGKGTAFKLDADEIAIVRLKGSPSMKDEISSEIGETVSAFINVCPHQHTTLVDGYGGQIANRELTCPMHGWTYDLGTGGCLNGSGKLTMLQVKIQGGDVYVKRRCPEKPFPGNW